MRNLLNSLGCKLIPSWVAGGSVGRGTEGRLTGAPIAIEGRMQWKGGFSLLQLLAVIAIVGILMVVTVPAISRAKRASMAAKCVGNLRQLGAGFATYAADHGGLLPPSYSKVTNWKWNDYLQNRDGSGSDNEGVLPNQNQAMNGADVQTVYVCPANPGRIGAWREPNYACNRAIGVEEEDYSSRARMSAFPFPGRTVLLVDAGHRSVSGYAPERGPETIVCYLTDFHGSAFGWQRSVNFEVHGGLANFLMVDGHVESLGLREVEKRGNENSLLWSKENRSGKAWFW